MTGIRSFFRHIRDGFRNLFRNGWMTSASILMMTITLFLLGLFMVVVGNIQELTQSVEDEVQVRVLIDPVASTEDEAKLGQNISKIAEVTRVVYRSADEELEQYKETITEDFDVLDNEANPLNNMYLVNVASTQEIQFVSDEIQKMDFVLSATIGSLNIDGLIKGIEMVRYIIAIIAALFIIIAILLISNTISLTINARATEIEIMRLVGAKRSYIRAPFIFEGVLIGIVGASLSSALVFFSYQSLLDLAKNLFAFNPNYAMPIWPNFIYMVALIAIGGIFLGGFASKRAIRKLL